VRAGRFSSESAGADDERLAVEVDDIGAVEEGWVAVVEDDIGAVEEGWFAVVVDDIGVEEGSREDTILGEDPERSKVAELRCKTCRSAW
jgi:hypothetical protein